MVALVLIVLIFTLIPTGALNGQRAKLEEVIFDLQRAVRFSVNESILRNSIVRISIDLEKNPIEYSVEYGPSTSLVLPAAEDESKMSLRDRENQAKVFKNIDAQFNRVDEFQEEAKKLPDDVKIIGLASSYLNAIKIEGKLSIYFYPTGEKDNALIFLSTEEEFASLDIPPFEDQMNVEYSTYSDSDLVNLDDSQDNRMKDAFEKWIKE